MAWPFGFACGVRGCTFHGVSPENGPRTDISVITPLMNILDFSVDLQRFQGTVTYNSTLQQLPVTGAYDLVYSHVVLEHVHELHTYLHTFDRLLKLTGRLIIAVPNYTSYDADFYGEFWAAYDVPRHLYHFSAARAPASIPRKPWLPS